MMDDGIFILKDYGKTDIALKEMLEKRNMTRNKLCGLIGAHYDLVNRYYQNRVSRIDLDTISKMCYVLKCDISDLLKYSRKDG